MAFYQDFQVNSGDIYNIVNVIVILIRIHNLNIYQNQGRF